MANFPHRSLTGTCDFWIVDGTPRWKRRLSIAVLGIEVKAVGGGNKCTEINDDDKQGKHRERLEHHDQREFAEKYNKNKQDIKIGV